MAKNITVKLLVKPVISLVDDELHIQAFGLPSQSKITIVCRIEEKGIRFFAWGYYMTDEYGQVDVKSHPTEPGGSYHGVEPMGLIWSQIQEPGQQPGRRIVKLDVTTPLRTRFYALNGFQSPENSLNLVKEPKYICSTNCERWYLAPGVQRIVIQDNRLSGTMFIPAGPGPFPGVLDLFGTIGGITEHRAALLASRGIASLALGYFKIDGGEALQRDIEYFEEAVDHLLKHPKVMKPYAGIIGVSQGAVIALLLSSVCHKIKACIEINGVYVTNATDYTYKQETFPCIEFDFDRIDLLPEGALSARKYTKSLHAEVHKDHLIPLERADCQFIFMHGVDDGWIPHEAADYMENYLQNANKTNYRVVKYPGAGHLLEPPHSPHCPVTNQVLFGGLVLWGGEARQHARAQEQSWQLILEFFKTTLTEANSKKQYRTPKHKI